MDRRDFIKLTAVTGTTATLAGCGNPEHQIIRFVPDDDLVPGVAEWKPSVCPLCSAGCGVTARHLHRLMRVWVGYGPKRFASSIHFDEMCGMQYEHLKLQTLPKLTST